MMSQSLGAGLLIGLKHNLFKQQWSKLISPGRRSLLMLRLDFMGLKAASSSFLSGFMRCKKWKRILGNASSAQEQLTPFSGKTQAHEWSWQGNWQSA